MTRGDLVALRREKELGAELLGIVILVCNLDEVACVAWTEGSTTRWERRKVSDLIIVTDENLDEIQARSTPLMIRP